MPSANALAVYSITTIVKRLESTRSIYCTTRGTRGSLEIDKLADLLVLSDNPLTGGVDAIRDIKVLATYKEGRLVFQAPQ